ncbi:ATP phosphoribosyltransferase [Cycloclasticus sp. P1]|uniref:ATP phosphoribosyltransferase n=1 Tax=Cycloclasticus sp. (strain P1) TaxID=385025 RepID=UPI000286AFA0|nr:ATP phosphoribosyltransferase [Cycloclasticus sp. P1]AFT67668.1 ATP phosphoribosyltransferase catalytic subunit [Cycloclasticus sp. P1]
MLTIAISKGRILKDTLPLLAEAGIEPSEDLSKTRKLIVPSVCGKVNLVIIRATDVPTFVEYGAADVGVTGKDTLVEHGSDNLYEPLDLNIAKCRLMTAIVTGKKLPIGKIRVASKYVSLTEQYFAKKGQQVEIIKLYGSMELAPIVGLADCIVDLVDTGNTLKANGMEPLDFIMDISSRLVINKASMKMKYQQIKTLIKTLEVAVDNRR